jgi:type IV secretion system protein VirD4
MSNLVQRTSIGLLSLTMASSIGGAVFAFQNRYDASLGHSLWHIGRHQLYAPTAYPLWLWRWGGKRPAAFQLSGSVAAGVLALGLLSSAKRKDDESPRAQWATPAQIRRAKLLRPEGIVLGLLGTRVVRHQAPGHVLVVASTQSGKSTSLVIPTILDDNRRSMLILDPKDEGAVIPGGEIYQRTAGYRATVSKVVRFQPLSEVSHQYNPLNSIRLRTPFEIRDLQIVADLLGDSDGDGGDHQSEAGQHFRQIASDVHVGVLAHGLYSRQATTLGTCYHLWCGNLQLADLVKTMETTRHVNGQCHPAVVHAVRLIKETADKELSALVNTARRALRLWADPLVCRATDRSDFTLKDLREGVRPLSLYLSFPFSDIERLRPLSRLVIRQCLEHAASRKTGWRWDLVAMLDEFQSLRRLPILRHGLNYFLGMGVTMCLITPSLNEVEDIWGLHHPFLEGCATKVVFGVRDARVAGRFSDSIGATSTPHARESLADSPTGFGKRRSISTEEREEPLFSSTAVMGLDEDTVLALVGRHTMRLQKARYWNNAVWNQRAQR